VFYVSWDVPEDAAPGTYRIVHDGNDKGEDGKVNRFEGTSREFQVK